MNVRPNTTLHKLRAGEIVLGGETVTGCRGVPLIYADAGMDFICLDMEHGGSSIETVAALIQTSRLVNLTPLVRVNSPEYHLIAPLLDNGAQGIIVPRVEDRRVVERVVSWCRFPPQGVRGCGSPLYANDYRALSLEQYVIETPPEILVAVQAETGRAIEVIDEIVAVEGLNLVIIGLADLSLSLGLPGEFDHPVLTQKMEQIISACSRHGIYVGIAGATNPGKWIPMGIQFLSCLNDIALLSESCLRRVQEIRKAL